MDDTDVMPSVATNVSLMQFDEVEATLAEAETNNKALVFDYEDPRGNREARSHIFQLRTVKTRTAAIHKAIKADALAFGRACDEKKRMIVGRVDAMIAVHETPLKAIEDRKEAERLAAEKAIEDARLAEEARKQKEIEEREAELARKQAELDRKQLEIETKQRAIEEAEAERKRQAQAAIEAEEARKKQAALVKEAAERAAENARRDAEAKAKADAEAKEAEAERIRLVAAEAERKRVENKKHRMTVQAEIAAKLNELTNDESMSVRLIAAIDAGEVPHVTIQY